MAHFKRAATASLAALAVVGSLATSILPADAAHGRHGAAAAGIIGGLAAGALVGGALAQPGYPTYAPAPYAPAYDCGYTRQPVYDEYGNFAGYRRVPAC